jgi:hypothetical protein
MLSSGIDLTFVPDLESKQTGWSMVTNNLEFFFGTCPVPVHDVILDRHLCPPKKQDHKSTIDNVEEEGITADLLKAANVKLMAEAWTTAIPTTHNTIPVQIFIIVVLVIVTTTLYSAMMIMMMKIAVEVILH